MRQCSPTVSGAGRAPVRITGMLAFARAGATF